MKKLFLVLTLLVVNFSAFALDIATLRMDIKGPVNDNRYFLCLPNMGCMSILAGNRGKGFPVNPGKVQNIMAADMKTRHMDVQPLPASCNVSLRENQTLIIKGNLITKPNRVNISNLHCRLS